jgi:hypothetical protein
MPLRPAARRTRVTAVALVIPVALAAGGGYAVAAAKPLKVLSTVCVTRTGAVAVPKKGKCAKGATLERLAPPLAGKTGKTGAPGPAGPTGPAGNNGLATTTTATYAVDVPDTGLFTDTAHCAPGSVATGGGYDLGGYDARVTVAMSKPDVPATSQVATGWIVRVHNTSGASVHVTIYALCAQPAVG